MPKIPCRVESGPEGGRRGSRHVAEEKEAQDAAAISPGRVWAICRPSALSFPVNGLRPDRIPPLHISGPSPTHCARRLTACAEGAVPSVPARPAQGRGPEAGQEAPAPCRLASQATTPGGRAAAVIRRLPGKRQRPPHFPRGAPSLPQKRQRGRSPEEDRPLCKTGLSTGSRCVRQLPAAQGLKEEEPLVHHGEHGHGEQDAVRTVQDAAVPGQQVAGVLHMHRA